MSFAPAVDIFGGRGDDEPLVWKSNPFKQAAHENATRQSVTIGCIVSMAVGFHFGDNFSFQSVSCIVIL